MRKRTTISLLALACVLGSGLPARAQADFSSYVSIGDSLAAGYSSGSLVETHQKNSVPALLARQAGVADFEQPTVSEPGIPAELMLVSLAPTPVILPKSTSTGLPTNLALPRPYNNLAVPGANASDALLTVRGGNPFDDLILRRLGPQVAQAVAQHPTFVTLWIGNNDVLTAALTGRVIEGVTITPAADFRQSYAAIVVALKASGTTIVAANLPDVTTIPFVTTIPPVVVNPATGQPVIVGGQTVPLLGPQGPLPGNAFVTLAASSLLAQGIGIPVGLGGQGTPLPDNVILDAGEVQSIKERVIADNQAIADICSAAGVPVLDVNGVLADLAANGRDVGGIHLTTDFLTGGVFSYDGVHPTSLGYAIAADQLVQFINSTYGNSLPRVDIYPFLFSGNTSSGGYPIGAALAPTPTEQIDWAAAVFGPDTWHDRLRYVFPNITLKSRALQPQDGMPISLDPGSPAAGRDQLN
jgi:lysophospholipase L1-like esterase